MRALGIDPGSHLMGWGLVEQTGTRLRHIAHGVLKAPADDLTERLVVLDQLLTRVCAEQEADSAAVEGIFFAKNAQSAAKLGHARGVALVCLRRSGLKVAEYSPTHIKRAVVGKGRATKEQMQLVVRGLLGLKELPPSDAADALAVAITHLRHAQIERATAAMDSRLVAQGRVPTARGRQSRMGRESRDAVKLAIRTAIKKQAQKKR